MEKCPNCEGAGYYTCTGCGGRGSWLAPQLRLNMVTNTMESQMEYTLCSVCGGPGKVMCSRCQGTGHLGTESQGVDRFASGSGVARLSTPKESEKATPPPKPARPPLTSASQQPKDPAPKEKSAKGPAQSQPPPQASEEGVPGWLKALGGIAVAGALVWLGSKLSDDAEKEAGDDEGSEKAVHDEGATQTKSTAKRKKAARERDTENASDTANSDLLALATRVQEEMQRSHELFEQANSAIERREMTLAARLLGESISTNRDELRDLISLNKAAASAFADPAKSAQRLSNSLLMLADVLESLGKRDQVAALRAEADEVASQYMGSARVARQRATEAVGTLVQQGLFNEALVTLSNALDTLARLKDPLGLAQIGIQMTEILRWLGDDERALATLNEAMSGVYDLATRQPAIDASTFDDAKALERRIASGAIEASAAEEGALLFQLITRGDFFRGIINMDLGHLEEAEQLLLKVLPTNKKLGVGSVIENRLAVIAIRRGQFSQALDLLTSVEREFRGEGLLRPKLAAVLTNKAEALWRLGRSKESLDIIEGAIEDLKTYPNSDLLWRAQWLKARVLQSTGDKERALSQFQAAAATVNTLRRAPLGYRLDSTYLANKLELFNAGIELACDMERPRECCELMEMIKSRILAAALSVPRPGYTSANSKGKQKGDGGLEELKRAFDEMTRRLDSLEYTIQTEGPSDATTIEFQELLARRADLLEKIRYSDPRWRIMTTPLQFDFAALEKLLVKRRQSVLSLFHATDQIIAVLVTGAPGQGNSSGSKSREVSTSAKVSSVPLSDEVRGNLNKYVANLLSAEPNREWYDPSEELHITADQLVPRNLLEEALRAEQLIIVPHGILHLLPWSGLVLDGKRLFEHCSVGILPNLTSIGVLAGAPREDGGPEKLPRAGLIGAPDYSGRPTLPDLAYTQGEIDLIRDMYSGASRLIAEPLTRKAATQAAFWTLARNAASGDILHVACHAGFVADEPMRSGLLLSDARLDAAEIALSSLPYGQVVLSACSTGYRPVDVQGVALSGDDIVGLPGALLEAGVGSVLVSIPPAADNASFDFMIAYHAHRVDGMSPLEAMQATQKWMLEESTHNVHTWLGFTLYGCN